MIHPNSLERGVQLVGLGDELVKVGHADLKEREEED